MSRLFRLLLIAVLACALPLQAAVAFGAQAMVATPHGMTMADGSPCPHHAPAQPAAGHGVDKAGCGACCGPVGGAPVALAVAPAATRVATVARPPAAVPAPDFLTSGPERPPRSSRA